MLVPPPHRAACTAWRAAHEVGARDSPHGVEESHSYSGVLRSAHCALQADGLRAKRLAGSDPELAAEIGRFLDSTHSEERSALLRRSRDERERLGVLLNVRTRADVQEGLTRDARRHAARGATLWVVACAILRVHECCGAHECSRCRRGAHAKCSWRAAHDAVLMARCSSRVVVARRRARCTATT